jgi:tetratricopeptide (TPR) repeat protein
MLPFLYRTIFPAFLTFSLGYILCGQDPSNMPIRQVISETQALVGQGDFAGATPFLDELELRFQDEKDPKVEVILQQFGFVRGVGYLQTYAETAEKEYLSKAAKAFGDFADKFPKDPKAVTALQKRTDCLRSDQQWNEAADVISKLLDPNQPFRKQILKRSELLNLYFGKAQCYHMMQDWAKGEPAFRELLKFADAARDEDRAAYAISCLTEMFVQTKRVDEVFPMLPRLSADTPARYDLRLNVNLMQGGNQLKEQERYVEASLLYALTMTAEEIKNYYEERASRLENERNRLATFLKRPGMPQRRLEILRDRDNQLAMKLTTAKSHLAMANKTASFTAILRWRKATNFQDTKRFWESFWGFYWLFKDDPENESAEDFIYAAFASANTVKFADKSIELGEEYLANDKWEKYQADVTNIMANAYRKEAEHQASIAESLQTALSTLDKERASKARESSKEKYQRFFELCNQFLERNPGNDYATSFINMMGSVYFKQRQFDQLLEKFAGFEAGVPNDKKGYINNKDFSKGPAMPSALYLSGIGLLASGKFNEAKPLLAPIVGVYVEGLPLADGTLSGMSEDKGGANE